MKYIILLIICNIFTIYGNHRSHFLDIWAVLVQGGLPVAKKIAEKFCLNLIDEEQSIVGLYYFKRLDYLTQTTHGNEEFTNILQAQQNVTWVEQVFLSTIKPAQMQPKMKYPSIYSSCSLCFGKQKSNEIKAIVSIYDNILPDPLWKEQWYMHDYRDSKDNKYKGVDLNIAPLWYYLKNSSVGLLGRNILVMITEVHGIDVTHDDLKDNINPRYLVNITESFNMYKKLPLIDNNINHGTMVAGAIAMKAANRKCGVGIAPLADIGVITIGNFIIPSMIYNIFTYAINEVHILNMSWGTADDGQTHVPMSPLSRSGIVESIKRGRNGKGILSLVASGNGRKSNDNCAYDEYANIMYTITVTSSQHDGKRTYYANSCSAVLVTIYGGDKNPGIHNIRTANYNNTCTNRFVGTSAAVSIMSGILALLLEAFSDLCWRQVQHLIVYAAQVAPLYHERMGWKINGAGLYYHMDFGFGLANALNMVKLADKYQGYKLPPMSTCVVPIKLKHIRFGRSSRLRITFKIDGCKNKPSRINYLEHVYIEISTQYPMRGAVEIDIKSAMGSVSKILPPRLDDNSDIGLTKKIIDTVHFWGENPDGSWTIQIQDKIGDREFKGELRSLKLILHGTKKPPPHYIHPKVYNKFN